MSAFSVTMVGDTHIQEPGGYDGSDLLVPAAALVLGMGDWVNLGTEAEYDQAVAWATGLDAPFLPVRGNHDNGPWNRYAKRAVPSAVAAQLDAHSTAEQMRVVEWLPNIWQVVDGPILNLPKQTAWHQLPGRVQNHILKLRDVTPGYYRFDAGGMRFVCLDASDWLLGQAQMAWLETQVADADRPVVIVSHHHALPVGIIYDGAQVHERDFLRRLMLDDNRIVAYLHGHAHMDQWWRYGDVDIIAVRNRACRTVTFENGRVAGSVLDGSAAAPKPFTPRYLCAQCMKPGQVSYVQDAELTNIWGTAETHCFGWLPPDDEHVELTWSMRLPHDVSPQRHNLAFQVRTQGQVQLTVSAPGLSAPVSRSVPPAPEGRRIAIDIGPLCAGYTEAVLRCAAGWGYVAIDALIEP